MEAQGKTAAQYKQNENLHQQNSSEAVSTQIGYAPVRLEAQDLTRPTEIQNSIALAKPAADRAVPCRKSVISQQQNGGEVVSTQIGHAPVRLKAQGQKAVQCRKNEIWQQQKNSSGAILTQIGHEPGRLEPRDRQQFSTDKTRICSSRTVSAGRAILRSSRTVAGQCQIRSAMHPFRLEVATTESGVVRVSDTSHLTRPTVIQNSQALTKQAADRAVPCKESEIS